MLNAEVSSYSNYWNIVDFTDTGFDLGIKTLRRELKCSNEASTSILDARVDAVEIATKKLKENEQKYTWPNQRKTEEEVRMLEIELKAFMKDIEYLRRDVDKKRK
jgi:hypothetical protein